MDKQQLEKFLRSQEVLVAFQIREYAYEGVERELLGVFTTIDRLQEVVEKLDPVEAVGSSVCYYIAELDAPGKEAQWEMFKDFPEPSSEEALAEIERGFEKADAERQARIDRNRRDFFRDE